MQEKVFIIAEAGVNHNGSIELAKKLIDVAYDAKADAVKFQTFIPEEVVTKNAPKATYQISKSEGDSQLEMISKLCLKYEDFEELNQYCQARGIQFLSTAFDLKSLDFLISKMNIPVIKIASGEITNAPLLYRAALSDKPIIVSTGMATLTEIQLALGVLAFGYTNKLRTPRFQDFEKSYSSEEGQQQLKEKVTLLHCTTAYPTPFSEVNLNVLRSLSTHFSLPIGFSDHSLGINASLASIAMGAKIVEKHFTLDKSLPGPDHQASLDPNELKNLVNGIREIETCMGHSIKEPTKTELENKGICRRSLVSRTEIHQGEKFTEEMLAIKRPETGLSPMFYWDVLETTAQRAYHTDEIILKEQYNNGN